ncbi:ATP-binding protein [Candidatus Saccharibacteria bacterium]|nr:ATP-binding protein [Candidatus Saccharibacteria bacterium]
MGGIIVGVVIVVAAVLAAILVAWHIYKTRLRSDKNFERGLKMVSFMIHLPPPTDDIDAGNRDARDVTEESISQSQTMYNIISSIALKGFKSRLHGQRHISFEITATKGVVHFYVSAPHILMNTIEQSVLAAYPMARLQPLNDENVFNQVGKINSTLGGEFFLKKDYAYPIASYEETKKDGMIALLNVLSQAEKDDGVGIQIMLRPANPGWRSQGERYADNLKKGKKIDSSEASKLTKGWTTILAKPLEVKTYEKYQSEQKPLSKNEEALVDALEGKARQAGYETLIRVVTSSNTNAKAQVLLNNVVSVFSQFDSPIYNGFKFYPTKDIRKLVTSYIMRFFPQTINSNILNTVELATLFHLPRADSVPTSALVRQEFKQVDGPSKIVEEGLLLGNNVFRGVEKPIRLSEDDRRRHIYIMGSTGMGKTVLEVNLALQDMIAGRGFCFIDPHGDAVERLLGMVPKNRVEDIIYFNPADLSHPIGMNIFEIDPNDPDRVKTKDFIISETVGMLYSLYDPGHTGIVGPRMENIVRNAAHLIMDSPEGGTFMDIPTCLLDPQYVKSRIQHLTNDRAKLFWTQEWPNAQRSNDAGEVTSWVVSKWAQFETTMTQNILGQTKSGLDLRDIMDNKKILLVNLSKGAVGEVNAKLLGMMFVMKFQAAAMGRVNIPEEQRHDFCLFVDEFQNFATDSFESILSEARKFRLNLIVANQFMSQLTDKIKSAIIGNAGSFLIGRVGFEDAEQLVKNFSPTFDIEDMQRLPNYMTITKVLVDGYPSKPFTMSTIPPMGKSNPDLADAVKRLSLAKYGRPRAEVEQERHERLNSGAVEAEEKKKEELEHLKMVSYGGRTPTAQPIGPVARPEISASAPKAPSGGSTFLDDWLTKRSQVQARPPDEGDKKHHHHKDKKNVVETTTKNEPTQQPVPVQAAAQVASPAQQAPEDDNGELKIMR